MKNIAQISIHHPLLDPSPLPIHYEHKHVLVYKDQAEFLQYLQNINHASNLNIWNKYYPSSEKTNGKRLNLTIYRVSS